MKYAPEEGWQKISNLLITQAVARPDNSGIPKQDVEFKFTFTVQSDAEQPPSHAVMFEWFGETSDKI